jgi:YihY family inner membrane protein
LAAVPFILLLLIVLTHLAQLQGSSSQVDIHELLQPFLPPHVQISGHDPFGALEGLLAGIARNRDRLTFYAVPSFIWFSTSLFAGIRTALNHLYDVSLRESKRHFVLAWLLAKLRDITMVVVVVTLFLLNTVIGTVLTVVREHHTSYAMANFFLSKLGLLMGGALSIVFTIALFFLIFRHASLRRLSWQSALVAATFTTIAGEVAKRLFGFYLSRLVTHGQFTLDANLGALILFILWTWYTSMVFLLGGVVAETWDLRARQQEQQAILT